MTEKKVEAYAMNHDLHDEVDDKWNSIQQNVQNLGNMLCAG